MILPPTRRHERKRGERFALLFLFLLVTAFFGTVLIGSDTMVTSNMSRWLPWRADASISELNRPGFRDDSAQTYFPRRALSRNELAAGRIPLWNRFNLCGTPHLADFQSAVLHPLNLILYPADNLWATGVFVVVHLLLGSVFLFLLLRDFRIGTVGALIGALSFLFNAYFITYLGHPTHISTGCWIPLLLLLVRRQITGGIAILLPAIVLMTILGGFPQTILYSFIITAAFALFTWTGVPGKEKKRGLFRLAVLALLFILGIGIALFQILPTAELSSLSDRQSIPLSTILEEHQPSPYALIRMLLPDFFGNPVSGTYWLTAVHGPLTHPMDLSFIGYGGVLPLLLAIGALFFSRRREVYFFGATAILFLLLAFSPLVFSLFYRLGPFARFSTELHRLQFPVLFCVAVLAGFGFDAIRSAAAKRTRLFVLIWLMTIPLGASLLIKSGPEFLRNASNNFARIETESQTPGMRPVEVPPLAREFLSGGVDEWMRFQWKGLLHYSFILLAGGGALLVLSRRERVSSKGAIGLLLLTIAADGWIFAKIYYTPQPAGSVFADHSSLEPLCADDQPFRVARCTQEYILPSNCGLPYGIEDLGGVNALLPSGYGELFHAIHPNLFPDGRRVVPFNHPNQILLPVWRFLNVKYFLVGQEPGDGSLTWRDFLSGRDNMEIVFRPPLILIENREVLPRAFLRHRYTIEKERENMISKMISPDFDPHGPLLLEEDPSLPQGEHALISEDRCRVVSREGSTLAIETESREAGLLFLSETCFPGWEASVDGVEAPILRANTVFRAVPVPAGRHTVLFQYRPRSFRLGMAGSILFAAIYLLLAGMALRKRVTGIDNSGKEV